MSAQWSRSSWPHGIQRESGDPLRYPCPICGSDENESCQPLRASRDLYILRPHAERGLIPYVLLKRGYTELSDGRFKRPKKRVT